MDSHGLSHQIKINRVEVFLVTKGSCDTTENKTLSYLRSRLQEKKEKIGKERLVSTLSQMDQNAVSFWTSEAPRGGGNTTVDLRSVLWDLKKQHKELDNY